MYLCMPLAQEQDDQILVDEIAKAHVVCVVYDLTQENSLDRVSKTFILKLKTVLCICHGQVTTYWLPLIKQCSVGVSKPVILAGNKVSQTPVPHSNHQQRTCGGVG